MRKKMSSTPPDWFKRFEVFSQRAVAAIESAEEVDEITPLEVQQCVQLNEAIRQSEHPLFEGIRKGLASKGFEVSEVTFGPMVMGDSLSEYGVVIAISGAAYEYDYSYPENAQDQGSFVFWEKIEGTGADGEWERDLRLVEKCVEQLSA